MDEYLDDKLLCFQKLKDATILKFTSVIDFDSDSSLYEILIKRFFSGELDDDFTFDEISNLDKDEKLTLLNNVRKYKNLCFGKGGIENWPASIEDLPFVDYEMSAYTIMDNFRFLVTLYMNAGNDSMEFLKRLSFQDMFKDKSIIDRLRITFIDDRVLTIVLKDMTSEVSSYDIFNNSELARLLCYPDGSLYACDKNAVLITSPLILAYKLYSKIEGKEDNKNFRELKKYFYVEPSKFKDAVYGLVDDYREFINNNNIFIDDYKFVIKKDSASSYIMKTWELGHKSLKEKYNYNI